MSNEYADRARANKAAALAGALRAAGATSAEVAVMDDEGKRAAETLARVNKGSARTWEMVAGLLRGMENVTPLVKDDDPFAFYDKGVGR